VELYVKSEGEARVTEAFAATFGTEKTTQGDTFRVNKLERDVTAKTINLEFSVDKVTVNLIATGI
jgi:hypothetical protein